MKATTMKVEHLTTIALAAAGMVWGSLAHAAPATSGNSPLNLIPWPKAVQMGTGGMALKASARIVTADPRLLPLAGIFKAELFAVTGLDLKIMPGPLAAGDIGLALNPNLKAGEEILRVKARVVERTREGAYRLTVGSQVKVEGSDYRAVAEGTTTLLQAIVRQSNGFVLPVMTIDDWPHADYTGAMIDTARQDNPIVYLKQMIDTCRAYKVRYLQLHMTDDQAWTFPSTAFPKLGTLNGSAHGGPKCEVYKLDELKALVKYADEQGVTLVPELETPGHSGNACGTLPECFGYIDSATGKAVGQGMMNIANPKLYETLDTIIGETCDVFQSSPYFHIGFDEVSGAGNVAATPQAAAFAKDKGLANTGELLGYFAVQVNEMVKKRGKKTIIWEGAANGASKDIICMTWDGGARTAERMVAEGFTTITVPWNFAGVEPQDWTMYHCNGSVLKKGDSVLGASLPVWEQKGEVSVKWLRAVPNRQERTWGPDNAFSPTNLARRIEGTDRVLDRILFGFAIRHDQAIESDMFRIRATQPTLLTLETFPAMGTVRYTLDGTEPTAQSAAADKPIRIADSFTLVARLFDPKGQPCKPPWKQTYLFEPLTITAQGMIKDVAGKDTAWFADTLTVSVACTQTDGKVRYTVDGSDPLPASPAYTKAITLTNTATVKTRWFDATNTGRGSVTAAAYQKLVMVKHVAVGKPARILAPADLANGEVAARLLTDGILIRGGEWGAPEVMTLGPKDLELVIDLGKSTEIHQVVARFVYLQEGGILPAVRVDVSVSDDGQTFAPIGTISFAIPDNHNDRGMTMKELSVAAKGSGRYVKVFCKNNGVLPDWYGVPGTPDHMMMDEILVNP
jgi:hexosaminidase